MHRADLLADIFPASQSEQSKEPMTENFPAEQGLHPPLLYSPAGQGISAQLEILDEHDIVVLPRGQVEQVLVNCDPE